MANSRARITQLDGLRAIAILTVMLHHYYHVKLLWMGVDLFFVLSGFLITGILYNAKHKGFGSYIGHFYERRVKRIMPPYLVLLVIAGFVFGFGYLRHWYMYIGMMNFFYLFHLDQIDYLPLWSLALEEQFYLLWPLAVFWLDRKTLIRLAAGLLVLAPLLRFLCTPLFEKHWNVYMLLPFRMDTMAAGALIALLWPELQERLEAHGNHRLRPAIAGAFIVAAVAALGVLVLLAKHGVSSTANTRLGNTAIYECTLIIVTGVFLTVLLGFGKHLLSSWPLMWIGRVSYSMYLIHLTLVYFVEHHSTAAFYLRWGRPLAAIATFVYALVMWFILEKPLSQLGQTRPKVLVTN